MKTHTFRSDVTPSDWFASDPAEPIDLSDAAELDSAWLHWTQLLDTAEGNPDPPAWEPPRGSLEAAAVDSNRRHWRATAFRAIAASAAVLLLAGGVAWLHRAAGSATPASSVAVNRQAVPERETTSDIHRMADSKSLAVHGSPSIPKVGSTSDAWDDLNWNSAIDSRLSYVYHLLWTMDRKLEPDEAMLENASWAVYALALEVEQSEL